VNGSRDFDHFKRRVREGVEESLARYFSACPDTEVCRVAKYAALGGGRRWRAMAAVAAGQVFHDDARAICMPVACAVELAHAASLVLDDLPSMDNARLRRGKPCAHLLFARWAVDMAPAFLVNMAYGIALANPRATPERRLQAAIEVSRAAAHMFEGQEIDLTNAAARGDLESLLECCRLKSGALYAAAAKTGAILCGAPDPDASLLYEAGTDLGMSYQFLDDIADATACVEEVGKHPGMDAGKITAVRLFGVEGARSRAGDFARSALARLERFGPEADLLRSLVRNASSAADC
jgi:geranylgeranyl diphosphate synthase type II